MVDFHLYDSHEVIMIMSPRKFLLISCAISSVVHVAEALPSFGSKVPNGQAVPCPPSNPECSRSGYCAGLGHPDCGGAQAEDRVEGVLTLGPFGNDFRANGFTWTKELCETDSDGDGYTNGDELGDPCCVWTQGSFETMLDNMEGFLPSHPGLKDHIPPVGFTFDKASLCTYAEDEEEIEEEEIEEEAFSIDQYYNPGESRGSFEMRIKPYPIPVKETTYVNFIFNIPEDAPDYFHVVFGEAIVSQPDHLHHFVLHGCDFAVDQSEEGMPTEKSEANCRESNIGAWAPGSDLYASNSLDTGVVLGRGLGIEAILINVHYTDGVYEDPDEKTYRMATDGIRIHYTTDFRPFTSIPSRPLWMPIAPKELVIPPNDPRHFVSRTCNVNSACTDIDDEQLQEIAKFLGSNSPIPEGMEMTCPSIRFFCLLSGELGNAIRQLCPESCGLCDQMIDGEVNPRNPGSYRVTSINYHAHLIGREMYATLLREVDDETSLIGEEQLVDNFVFESESNMNGVKIIAKDLESRDFWDYNDQASIPFDFDIAESDQNNEPSSSTMRGIEVKPGDKIVVTCVYDSTGREKSTRFGLSTYDEMCIIGIHVTFETPKSLLENEFSSGGIDILTDMKLRLFTCEPDNENHTTDVHQGSLTELEDGRNIWFEHPIEESEMCTFPVQSFRVIDNVMSRKSRANCPTDIEEDVGMNEDSSESTFGIEEDVVVDKDSSDSTPESWIFDRNLCDGIFANGRVEFLKEKIAGYTCVGGKFNQKDSNEQPFNVTEKDCLEVGGGSEYNSYTCAAIEAWIQNREHTISGMTDQTLEFIRTEWWQPKCCLHHPSADISELDLDASEINFIEGAMSGGANRTNDFIVLLFFTTIMTVAMI